MVGPVRGAARRAHGDAAEGRDPARVDRRRVLARRREPADAAAHLRHGVGDGRAARGLRGAGGRGQAARPPRARQGARPVLDPAGRRRGAGLLAPEGRVRAQPRRELLEGRAHGARLRAAGDAAHGQRRPVEDVGPLRLLQGRHVRPDGGGGRRLPAQADELPLPRPHLQGQAALVPRPAEAVGRDGDRLPVRALGDAAGALPRARLHAGRRAHLLPSRAGGHTPLPRSPHTASG